MRLLDVLIGSRIATNEEQEQRVGPLKGIPMLGLDALGSSAYGPEAALTVMISLGAAAAGYALPIIGLITALLIVVYLSYRQTIAAYPNGGGSFTVANENLGPKAGVLAAAALMLDYILNAAVGISAGVGALVSAFPALNHYMLPLCLGILAAITVINLRGVRESGGAFIVPTYLFLTSMFGVLLFGAAKTVLAGGHPQPAVPLPTHQAAGTVSLWLLVRAFASGCTAMTGVEAVSNGVMAFKEPTVPNARRTLGILVAALVGLLILIAFLTRAFGIGATQPGSREYQSVVSQLVGAIVGRGPVYYVAIGSTLAVLCLSANTSFAGFPRLSRLLADHDYLPHAFANRGRRLVYTIGICVLSVLAGVLLIVFGGVTDRLIPLFAVGALLAFTLSQAGMVMHWRKTGGAGGKMALNLLGAVCTAVALLVVLAAKFTEGAWITVLIVGALIWLFSGIKRHYHHVEEAVACDQPLEAVEKVSPVVIVPVMRWNLVTAKALKFALSISDEVLALHVAIDDEEEAKIRDEWRRYVEEPLSDKGQPVPELTVVRSPYRRLFGPLLTFVARTRHRCAGQALVVVVSELVEAHWYQFFLHNQRATMLKAALLLHGGGRVIVANVPWYLKDPNGEPEKLSTL